MDDATQTEDTTANMATPAPVAPPKIGIAEAAQDLEEAREKVRVAKERLRDAEATLGMETDLLKTATAAFNEAVAAMKPKRKSPAPKPVPATAESRPERKKK